MIQKNNLTLFHAEKVLPIVPKKDHHFKRFFFRMFARHLFHALYRSSENPALVLLWSVGSALFSLISLISEATERFIRFCVFVFSVR